MEKKSIVEEALLSMKNLEEAVAENAKGILASTMKEEIKDLVKESLSEADDEEETEVDVDVDMDTDSDEDEMAMTMDTDDTDSDEDEMGMDMDMTSDEDEMDMDMTSDEDEMEPIDLTGASDEEILKVFKAMGDEDGIIVKKDDDQIHLTDESEDSEYIIDLGEESEGVSETITEDDMEEVDMENIFDKVFSKESSDEEEDESVMTEKYEEDEAWMDESSKEEEDEVVYEISLDETSDEEDESYMNEKYEEEHESESYDLTKAETKEGKMSIKPKGVGMGKPKFGYKKTQGGFDENMKHASPTKGTGKPKFEYKEGKMKMEKAETKEAARTLGMGSKFRKGGLPKPRSHSGFNANIEESVVNQYEEQLRVLREKNEEYRKALNIFREKLNEVAVFNSNLAYATRLFTEHSTTKQEKINILRRFDGAETLKESKNLYRTIKDELGEVTKPAMNESINEKIDREPVSGSAQNLIESKTYENPQFLRMRDLMSKLIK